MGNTLQIDLRIQHNPHQNPAGHFAETDPKIYTGHQGTQDSPNNLTKKKRKEKKKKKKNKALLVLCKQTVKLQKCG